MLTEKTIINKLKKLELDDRLKGKPAIVQVNAPLALIQVSLEAKINTLKWVLAEKHHLMVG